MMGEMWVSLQKKCKKCNNTQKNGKEVGNDRAKGTESEVNLPSRIE
jgi:hypothetical protein